MSILYGHKLCPNTFCIGQIALSPYGLANTEVYSTVSEVIILRFRYVFNPVRRATVRMSCYGTSYPKRIMNLPYWIRNMSNFFYIENPCTTKYIRSNETLYSNTLDGFVLFHCTKMSAMSAKKWVQKCFDFVRNQWGFQMYCSDCSTTVSY